MTQQKTNANYTLPIIMMFLLFFIISFVTGLQNPMGVIMKSQFTLSNFEAQFGNMSVFLAYLFMGIPSGILLQKVGYKKTALIALVTGFTGVLIMFLGGKTGSFPLYLVGGFISGFSMCMLNATVNPMLSILGNPDRANQRLNFGGAINSIGATLAPIAGGMVIGEIASAKISDANPLLYMAMSIFAIVFIVLSLVKIPEPHLEKQSTEKSKHSALSFRHFVLGMITIFFYVGVEVTIANTTNLYLTASADKGGLGFDTVTAGAIVGTYWFLMMIGRFIGGALGGKFSSKQMLTFVSVVALIFVALSILMGTGTEVRMPAISSSLSIVMAKVPFSIMLLILCGLCTSVMWPGIFNLATNGLGKYTAQGSGFFMTMVFGGGILPLLQAKIADTAGFASSYWIVVIGLAVILYFALIGSKNVNTDINVE